MNKALSQLCAEFEKMEQTIAFQQKVIASTAQVPVCPCGRINAAMPVMPKLKLDDCSWSEIAMYAQSGMADRVFALGDTKKITLNDDTTIGVRIIGFNHDNSDTGDLLPITFESVETLNDDFCMNETSTNKGGWEKSYLRSMLNGSFLNSMLPEDLRAVIKPCVKLTRTSGAENAPLGKTVDRVFVLSEQEVFGRKVFSGGAEGHWYDWYREENTPYGKCKQNGERDWRWERSPYSGATSNFCYVNSIGDATYANASNSYGVSFGFCV